MVVVHVGESSAFCLSLLFVAFICANRYKISFLSNFKTWPSVVRQLREVGILVGKHGDYVGRFKTNCRAVVLRGCCVPVFNRFDHCVAHYVIFFFRTRQVEKEHVCWCQWTFRERVQEIAWAISQIQTGKACIAEPRLQVGLKIWFSFVSLQPANPYYFSIRWFLQLLEHFFLPWT